MELQNKVIGILGRKGSGKSTILQRYLRRCPRFLLFDVMGEHRWVPNTLEDLDEVDRFLAWAETKRYAAARFIPNEPIAGDFAEVCEMVYETGSLTFAVEEVPLVARAGYLPDEFARVVRLGRHRHINLGWTAQRAAETPRTLTAMTDLFVVLSTAEPRDLDAIADRCGADVAAKVSRLPLHGFVVWDVVAHAEVGVEDVVGAAREARSSASRQPSGLSR